jgi:hypothetical protein
MSGQITSRHDCVECPYCGHEHGDAWEHCNSEFPFEFTCNNCEQIYEQWAVHDVTYKARPLAARTDPEER